MQAVINQCYGGFSLSEEAEERLASSGDVDWREYQCRTSPMLIDVIEELGAERAGTWLSNLVIVDIAEGQFWRIDEYDGYESIEYFDESKWFES